MVTRDYKIVSRARALGTLGHLTRLGLAISAAPQQGIPSQPLQSPPYPPLSKEGQWRCCRKLAHAARTGLWLQTDPKQKIRRGLYCLELISRTIKYNLLGKLIWSRPLGPRLSPSAHLFGHKPMPRAISRWKRAKSQRTRPAWGLSSKSTPFKRDPLCTCAVTQSAPLPLPARGWVTHPGHIGLSDFPALPTRSGVPRAGGCSTVVQANQKLLSIATSQNHASWDIHIWHWHWYWYW